MKYNPVSKQSNSANIEKLPPEKDNKSSTAIKEPTGISNRISIPKNEESSIEKEQEDDQQKKTERRSHSHVVVSGDVQSKFDAFSKMNLQKRFQEKVRNDEII